MMLREQVKALHDPLCACPGDGSDPDCNWHPGPCPVLALIPEGADSPPRELSPMEAQMEWRRPEGAVLVTEESLAAVLDESYRYLDDEYTPALPFVDDHEGFWQPFAATVIARLREPA